MIADGTPLLARVRSVVLGEGRGDEGGDDPPPALLGMGERIPREVDPAALPRRGQHPADGYLGRAAEILAERDRIKRMTIANRRF